MTYCSHKEYFVRIILLLIYTINFSFMHDKISLNEKVTVNKRYDTQVILEGKAVPIIHTWGKEGKDHPPTRFDKMKYLAKHLYKEGVQGWRNDNLIGIRDTAKIGTTQIVIEKWKDADAKISKNYISKGYNYRQITQKLGHCPLEEISIAHATPITPLNTGLNEGLQQAWDLIIEADAINYYTNALARCGVGDSNAAVVATQTDLQAVTNKLYKAMNATFPSRSAQTTTFKSDFITGEAEYAWEEYTVDNGATPTKNLLRALNSQGTKMAGVTWTLQLDAALT